MDAKMSRTFKNCKEIQTRLSQVVSRIIETAKPDNLSLIGLNKGSYMFLVELSRLIKSKTTVDMMFVDEKSGKVIKDIKSSLAQREVYVLVDRVADSEFLPKTIQELLKRGAASVRVLSVAGKKDQQLEGLAEPVQPLFEVAETQKLFGFGLEVDGRGANFPEILLIES